MIMMMVIIVLMISILKVKYFFFFLERSSVTSESGAGEEVGGSRYCDHWSFFWQDWFLWLPLYHYEMGHFNICQMAQIRYFRHFKYFNICQMAWGETFIFLKYFNILIYLPDGPREVEARLKSQKCSLRDTWYHHYHHYHYFHYHHLHLDIIIFTIIAIWSADFLKMTSF